MANFAQEPFHPPYAPLALRNVVQWVCWRKEQREGRWTKVPYSPQTGEHARTNDPATWGSYLQARQACEEEPGRYSGIGFVFQGDYTGIDLDHCVSPEGVIADWAMAILQRLNSYAEYSPNDGIHIIVEGTIPKGLRRPIANASHSEAALEMYCSGRYFTVTGRTLTSMPREPQRREQELLALYQEFSGNGHILHDKQPSLLTSQEAMLQAAEETMKAPLERAQEAMTQAALAKTATGPLNSQEAMLQATQEAVQAPLAQAQAAMAPGQLLASFLDAQEPSSAGLAGMSDQEVLDRAARAANGTDFQRLWKGDSTGYHSHSEADLALCGILAFWTGNDAARVDHLFRKSGLYRPEKWDRPARAGQTYGQGTVATACTGKTYNRRQMKIDRAGGSMLSEDAPPFGLDAPHLQRETREEEPARETTSSAGAALFGEEAWRPDPVQPGFVLRCLAENEMGDARLFAQLFQDRCVYDFTSCLWYLWQGHSWQEDRSNSLPRLVCEYVSAPYDEVLELGHDEETTKALKARVWTLRGLSRATNVLKMAQSLMPIAGEQWDTNPWLLGTRQGVLDLRTGKLRPGRPADYIRKVVPAEWRGLDEPAPRFEQFLHDIFADRPDEARIRLIGFLQRVLGYGITGRVSEHVFLLFYGEEGRNGKDTLMGTLTNVLGTTVGVIDNEVLIATGRNASPGAAKSHLCRLQGLRIAWASETSQGARFDIGQVKYLTGGGAIAARELYGKAFAFDPSHLLVLLTNHKPHADASDAAFWERLCPIIFTQRFVDQPSAPNERQRDRTLSTALAAEASGILAWLVRGCLAWQSHGLDLPPEIRQARHDYHEEEDTLGNFIRDCCILDPLASVRASSLYERYKAWAVDNGLKPLSSMSFGLQMKKRVKWQKDRTGASYIGIRNGQNEAVDLGTPQIE